jgi:periplasmic protein TonB
MTPPRVLWRCSALVSTLFLGGCETAPQTNAIPPATSMGRNSLPDAEVHDTSRLDSVPRPTFQSRPQYPFELRRQNVTGEAVVDFVIGTDGNVYNAYVIRETHPQFGAAAVACVAQWKFEPGRKNGRVVNTHMQVPIVFTLNQK